MYITQVTLSALIKGSPYCMGTACNLNCCEIK